MSISFMLRKDSNLKPSDRHWGLSGVRQFCNFVIRHPAPSDSLKGEPLARGSLHGVKGRAVAKVSYTWFIVLPFRKFIAEYESGYSFHYPGCC